MDERAALAHVFERARSQLRGLAFRMLGSLDEADDAVQETWLRASRAGASGVENAAGWLTTILGRVCLDALRARRRRSDEVSDGAELELAVPDDARGPEDEAELVDSVGLALLVVLDRLGPAERVAFVLHDLFGVPFDEIASIVERSPAAAKKLASRARHRVQGTAKVAAADLETHRGVVDAFLAASRDGDLAGLLAVLAPDVVRRADRIAVGRGGEREMRGALAVAKETRTNAGLARFARAALVDGAVGAVVAPRGRLRFVLQLAIEGGRVASIDVIGDPARLRQIQLGWLGDRPDADGVSGSA